MVRLLLSIFLLQLSFSLFAQNDTSYHKQWLQIDSLVWKKSLPQSALTKVNALYLQAKSQGKSSQVIKAILYKTVLEKQFKERDINEEIAFLKEEINKSKNEAVQSILASVLAEKIYEYLQNQRWRIYNRTNTASYKKEDIKTWTLEDLHNATNEWFRISLTNAALLKSIPIKNYNAILNLHSANYFRPTLYDLLAHRALEYYKSDETYLTKLAYQFTIEHPVVLGTIESFIRHNFTSTDTSSNKRKALILYQELLKFHLAQKDTAALIDVNLSRLNYVKQHGTFAEKDSLYEEALQQTATRFNGNRFSAKAWYQLAEFYASKAREYNPNTDTSNRFYFVKALNITQQFLPLKDSTEAHHNLYNLYHTILSKSVTIRTEEVLVPGLPIKALVHYKNVDTLYYRIIANKGWVADSIKKVTTNNRGDGRTIFSIAKKFPFVTQQSLRLPATKDYQEHAVEIKIDPLSIGEFYLLSSTSPGFEESSKLTWQKMYVSNISYTNSGTHYFVLNRSTGQPLAQAKVVVTEKRWNSTGRKYETHKQTYTTNSNGYFKLAETKSRSRNVSLSITYLNDYLDTEEANYVPELRNDNIKNEEEYEDFEEENARPFFFLDRSIYRPGQTVFFKLLAVTKDKKTKETKLFTDITRKDSVYLYLRNVNDDYVDSVLIELNDYGSFAGKFVLPANTLTGEFSLTAEFAFDDFNHSFSVEEYKRPTFFVDIKKPEGTYKLGDSITVNLQAKAYAGNATDGAKVKYTVTRKGRFLYPWMWWRSYMPVIAETVITTGETTTDAEGNLKITFEAEPDEETLKSQMPVYDFEIVADVTDRSGETRSGTTRISVAYHSLNLNVAVAEKAEADSLKNIFVSTTNLAGDKQSAIVNVVIYPLQSPRFPIKKRYWQQPDQFIYTKEEFKRFFPNDDYKDENNKHEWSKGTPVFKTTIDTKDSGRIVIPKGRLNAGWYRVEATTKDKDGNEIKDIAFVQLYSSKAGQFNGSEYLFSSVENNVASPEVPAVFLVGSPAENVFLIQQVQKKASEKTSDVTSEFIFHAIDKNVKRIAVTPNKEDETAIGVNFVFVKDNRCYTWSQRVEIINKEKPLDIEVMTYRDKLEPGSNETWTIKVKGANKEAAAAEVLTSMYDASLDQFKAHYWNKPSFPIPYIGYAGFNSTSTFGDVSSYQNNLPVPHHPAYFIYPAIDVYLRDAAKKLHGRNLSNRYAMYDMEEGNGSLKMMRAESALQGRAAGVSIQTDEVVVTGFQVQNYAAAPPSVAIRGIASLTGEDNPLVIVDGKIVANINEVNQDDIANMQVLKGDEATALYGARGANGVIIITTKNAATAEEPPVKIRTNFEETAFFFPQLFTDAEGNLSFTFTLPEALTQWKWQLFAHNKMAQFGLMNRTIVSQKTLMVQMNAPRFLREGDKINLSAKISNLSKGGLSGTASLQIIDAVTGEPIDAIFNNNLATKNFIAEGNQSTAVSFSLVVPAGFINPISWRIVAKAGAYSDGEENTIPILSNRMLVTESLPLFVRGNGTKHFTFNNLLNSNSSTLQHQSLAVEYTSNPIWNVVQALPYLMEFPYECAEQIFNRVYANALASSIVKNHPRIQQVFNEWLKDSTALLSNLEKNQELKNILLQETPWVLQANSESEQRKNISILFQSVRLAGEIKANIEKLKQMQMASGGFPWFKGGHEDRYITQYILTGIGRLNRIDALPSDAANDLRAIRSAGLKYLDNEISKDYKDLIASKADVAKYIPGPIQLQYLYMRSYFTDKKPDGKAYEYYLQQAKRHWVKQNSYFKAMIGSVLFRENDQTFVTKNIIPSLFENAIMDKDSAMYWKDFHRGYYWYQAPVEQQVLMIELVDEVNKSTAIKTYADRMNDMKTWLLKQKQTNHWSNTKATADACYALLSTGNNVLLNNRQVEIELADKKIISAGESKQEGTGYIKEKIEGSKVNAAMGNISITTTSTYNESTPSWGAVYWQYFEQLDKIPTATETPFTIEKKLFKETNTATGSLLQPVNNETELKAGDKIKVRIVLRSERNMEYIHLKDMRAAGMEPVNVLSSYKWQDGLGYYESTRDASTNFFIDYMPKGTYVFEYPLFVTHAGNFSVGIATAQCMYAPEFSSHSEGINVTVKGVQ